MHGRHPKICAKFKQKDFTKPPNETPQLGPTNPIGNFSELSIASIRCMDGSRKVLNQKAIAKNPLCWPCLLPRPLRIFSVFWDSL
jgi:hypothetical protein